MTDEERQRTMDFILAQQAQFTVNFEKAEVRVSRLERVVKLMIKAGGRARKEIREQRALVKSQIESQAHSFEALRESQAQSLEALRESFEALRESQAHSDRRLDALIDIVREQRNG